MKNNKRREYEQSPLGFLWKSKRWREREFRLEKWKKQQAPSVKMRDEKRKRELMMEEEETASNKQRWLTIKTCRGCLPGGRELVNYCWEEAQWAAPLLGCWCDCRNERIVGVQVSRGERLSVDLELLHRLPPWAIIHSTRAPHEADDGCLARGPSSIFSSMIQQQKK